MPNFSSYLSPFSWRYGSGDMRRLWSEEHKRLLWRRIWVALAETQSELGLVTAAQVEDLRYHADEVDVERSLAIEAEIHHDLMAEVKAFAEQCPVGGGIIHVGATSMDIEDNADALQLADEYEYSEGTIFGERYVQFTYASGSGSSFQLMFIDNLDHNYPNGKNHPVIMADILWKFFSQFQLP